MARLAKIVSGFTLIIAGLFMLVLPGPGIITILGGLALISQEYVWARQLSDWVKARFGRFAGDPAPVDRSRAEEPQVLDDQLGG
jgi:uncharacterized protein (TIGR02611 family)